jgi:hypothetical protein
MAEDYIMRLTAQIAAMLAAILGKRNDGKIAEARQDLNKLCLDHIGLPLSTVMQMTPEALRGHLAQSGGNRIHRSLLLAEMLIHDAEMSTLGDSSPEAQFCYYHAASLLRDSIHFLPLSDQEAISDRLTFVRGKLQLQ